MVDIHCHLLPGIDDGARTEEESVGMMKLAASCGTTDLVATPHADTQYSFNPETVATALALARLSAPEGLQLHRGCDFHLMHDNVQDALNHPSRYTINGGRYLLVEFSDLVIFENAGDIFDRLEAAGMVIIVTHPERNPLLRQRIELIEQWVAAGRLMQITAGSLLGLWGHKASDFCRLLLDRHLAHFVASDGHDTRGRQPRLDEAHAWLRKHRCQELADSLTIAHPKAVIDDRPIDLTSFQTVRVKRRSWIGRLFGSRKDPAEPAES